MATFFRPTPFRRFIAGLLSALLSLGPVATPAYAAVTSLADEPLATRNQSKPNILMTVDDSTSMLYDFLPDYVIDAYCRSGSGKMDTLCGYGGSVYDFTAAIPTGGKLLTPGYIYQQYNATVQGVHRCRGRLRRQRPGRRVRARQPAVPLLDRHRSDRRRRRPRRPQDVPGLQRDDQSDRFAAGRQAVRVLAAVAGSGAQLGAEQALLQPAAHLRPADRRRRQSAAEHERGEHQQLDAGAGRPVGGDRGQGRPHRQGHRRPVVQLRLDAGQRRVGQPVRHQRRLLPHQRHRRRDLVAGGRRRLQLPVAADRTSPPTTRSPRSTRPPMRSRARGRRSRPARRPARTSTRTTT